jgi:uncharacterized protein YjbI with pentapeptide repeats
MDWSERSIPSASKKEEKDMSITRTKMMRVAMAAGLLAAAATASARLPPIWIPKICCNGFVCYPCEQATPARFEGHDTGPLACRESRNGSVPNGTSLNGISINGVNLNGRNLNGRNLNGLNLNGLNLNGLNLNGLNLNGHNLNGVNLQGRDLNGISVNGLNLNGVSTRGVQRARSAATPLDWNRLHVTAVSLSATAAGA